MFLVRLLAERFTSINRSLNSSATRKSVALSENCGLPRLLINFFSVGNEAKSFESFLYR